MDVLVGWGLAVTGPRWATSVQVCGGGATWQRRRGVFGVIGWWGGESRRLRVLTWVEQQSTGKASPLGQHV
jgi:hypothetical protein